MVKTKFRGLVIIKLEERKHITNSSPGGVHHNYEPVPGNEARVKDAVRCQRRVNLFVIRIICE